MCVCVCVWLRGLWTGRHRHIYLAIDIHINISLLSILIMCCFIQHESVVGVDPSDILTQVRKVSDIITCPVIRLEVLWAVAPLWCSAIAFLPYILSVYRIVTPECASGWYCHKGNISRMSSWCSFWYYHNVWSYLRILSREICLNVIYTVVFAVVIHVLCSSFTSRFMQILYTCSFWISHILITALMPKYG